MYEQSKSHLIVAKWSLCIRSLAEEIISIEIEILLSGANITFIVSEKIDHYPLTID